MSQEAINEEIRWQVEGREDYARHNPRFYTYRIITVLGLEVNLDTIYSMDKKVLGFAGVDEDDEDSFTSGDDLMQTGATEWQIFEYDPSGPNLSSKKEFLRLKPGQFDEATAGITTTNANLRIVRKSLTSRSGAYFLVDDSGLAWKPAGEGFRHIMGHITTDRAQVLSALRRHIQELR